MAVRWTSPAEGSAVLKQARYRAPMLPIAPSVGRTTTRHPGSTWTTVVSGVLARKSKKERLEPHRRLRQWPEDYIDRRLRLVWSRAFSVSIESKRGSRF